MRGCLSLYHLGFWPVAGAVETATVESGADRVVGGGRVVEAVGGDAIVADIEGGSLSATRIPRVSSNPNGSRLLD